MAAIGNNWAEVWDETVWADVWDSGVADQTPDAFDFVDQPGIVESTANVTSNTVTISGLGQSVTASFTETGHTTGEYQLNGGSWLDLANISVSNTDTLAVRLDAGSGYLDARSIEITIGTLSDTFTVTTRSDPNAVAGVQPKTVISITRGMTLT